MDPLNGTNGCSNGANGDEVKGANGGPHHHWRQWMCPIVAIGTIVAIIAIGTIVDIVIPNDPFTLSGDREKGIAIEWF